MTTTPTPDDTDQWKCAKPDCGLDVDSHNLALAIEHAMYDEPKFTADDARDVADRTLARVGRAFGLDETEEIR